VVTRLLMRRSQRLSRTGKRRTALPPREQLRAEAKILLEIAPDDPKTVHLANAFLAVDEMIAGGYTVREGGGEATKQRPLLPEWRGKGPPERP
jgi:hypothetical protein